MSPKRDGTPKPEEISCQCIPEVVEGQRPPVPMPQVEVKLMKFDKPKKDEEICLSQETRDLLASRVNGCFLCRFILEDEKRNGKLTDYPFDSNGKGQFPVEGKVIHVQLERMSGGSAPPILGGAAKEKP